MKTTDVLTKLNNGETVLSYKGILKLVKFSKEFEEHFCTEVLDDDGKLLGFLSYYKLKDGKKNYLFMTTEEVKNHAKKFSISFRKKASFWTDNFSQMALITVHKLNLMNPKEPAYKIITETLKTIKNHEQDKNIQKLHS